MIQELMYKKFKILTLQKTHVKNYFEEQNIY